MMKNETTETKSLECKSCGSDFLALTDTKEFKLKICYRCFMNGLADSYLEENKED